MDCHLSREHDQRDPIRDGADGCEDCMLLLHVGALRGLDDEVPQNTYQDETVEAAVLGDQDGPTSAKAQSRLSWGAVTVEE